MYGSIAYEAIYMLHSVLLLTYFGIQEYGFIASFTSLILFAEQISGMGAAYSLGIFKSIYIKNKNNFFSFFCYFTLLPIVCSAIFVATGSVYWFAMFFPQATKFLCLLMWLNIVMGTSVAFMRMLLYAVNQTRMTVVIELAVLNCYVIGFWGWFWRGEFSSVFTLALFRFAHCFGLCFLFGVMIFGVYNSLPSGPLSIPVSFARQLWLARFNQWALRRGRSFFSSTFLTPFFALCFGMQAAALYHFMNKATLKLLDIMKAIIYFSLAPLLAELKNHRGFVRRRIFSILSFKTSGYLISGIIVIIFNYIFLLILYQKNMSLLSDLFFMMLMLLLRAIGYFMVLYEQVYNACGNVIPLVIIKFIEGIIFWCLLGLHKNTSLYFVFSIIAILQSLSLGLIILDARKRWGIIPSVGISFQLLTCGILFSLLVQGCLLWQ